jgi:multidrug efflux pump subunit AcrA (membrane-fusion protein)
MKIFFESLGATRSAPIARLSPSVDARTRTVEVIAVLDNGDESLKAGMLVRVDFPESGEARRAPAIAAPSGSVNAARLPASSRTANSGDGS